MAVGFPAKTNFATGDVLTATNMNDITGTLNLLESAQYAAGKNKIINGAFNVWQRGTSFNAGSSAYTADRWDTLTDKTGASVLTTQQAFTAGSAPVSGYESQYFLRTVFPAGGTFCIQEQRIEDVRTFAGQTVTLSFWAKANATVAIEPSIVQSFGSGGSSDVQTITSSLTLTTSWVRYSVTAAIPSISGKTIGANSYLAARVMRAVTASGFTIDLWGVQLEAGSVASPFQTASGTLQGELALCQRYYSKSYPQGTFADGVTSTEGSGQQTAVGTGNLFGWVPFKTTMRAAPTVNIYAGAGGSGSGSARNNSAGPVVTGIGVGGITQEGFSNTAKAGAFVATNIYGFEYTASAEL
jgi:hypothetical protein